MKSKLCGILVVVVLCAVIIGCTPPPPSAPPANLVKDTTIYNNPNNPFTQAIPTEATLHPNSASYISHLTQVANVQAWWNHDWSVPIFYASSSDARVDIAVGEGSDVLHYQRIPTCTTGQIAGEGHVTVVNNVEGCMQHFWGYNIGTWPSYPHAFWASAQPKDFDATWRAQAGMPSRIGPNAGGLTPMCVWPDELTSVIPRGQLFTLPKNHNKPTAVAPANHGDGIGTCTYDMEQGFRIRLNPSYTVDGLYTYEKVYGQALKTYGAFLMDSSNPDSGIIGFSGPPSKASCVNNFFAGMFPDIPSNETSGDIRLHYDLSQFQVMPAGAPVTEVPVSLYSTYCGSYNSVPVALAAPTLSSISPSTAAAGSTVTLTGTNLTGSYHVLFGTANAWNPTVLSSTQATCVVPAGSGTVAVAVRTGGGTSGTVNFTYGGGAPPTLTSLSPTSGTTSGGTSVTLTGTNLTGTTSVSFGGTAATGIVNMSATQVRCTSPAHVAGAVNVTATTPNGTTGAKTYTYTAPVPTLTSISPTSGGTGGGTACTLVGTGLIGTTGVSFGGTAATNIVVVSPTQVTCTSPAHAAGSVNVTATTAGGTTGTRTFTYTAPAPTLSSLSPNSGPAAGGTSVTLTGTNLTGTTGVSFGGTAATGIVNVSSTQVRCTSPAHAAGGVSVTATTGGGTSNGVTYTYTASAPTLSSLSPNSGPAAGGTSVTLTGTNLTGTTGVSFGGTAATGIVNVSSTQVRCTSPAHAAGGVSVTATTGGGTSNGVTYTYTSGSSYTTTLNATADCATYKANPGANYNGQRCNLQTNLSVDTYFFAKFSLTAVQGTSVTSAKFRWNKWGAISGYTIKAYSCSTDSWAETSITWNNKPAIGTQQASTTLTSAAGYFEWDVTSYVNSEFAGDKVVTLVMRDDLSQNINCQFYDKEAGANVQPQLAVISQ